MAYEQKIILITGANTGLGLEVVKALCKLDVPYEIIIGCRTISKGEDAIALVRKEISNSKANLSTLQIDLSSDSSIEKAIVILQNKFGRIDVLLNNGGANFDVDITSNIRTMRDAFNASWDVNVTGTHILTTLAVPLLLRSSDPRLLFVTSGTSTLAETEMHDTFHLERLNASPKPGWPKSNHFIPLTGYRCSKTGLNMLMREWHRMLLNDGVKVWCVSPGFLATGLSGIGPEVLKEMGALDPVVGANLVRDVIEGKRDQDVGRVVRTNTIQPW